jgi:hypothetical protein
MHVRSAVVFILVTIFFSTIGFACSCSNTTPIQKTSKRYRERAVFTARIVQLVGRTFDMGGKAYSEQALAVVQKRYWGLPWFWPKVVLLDGRYPCDIAMAAGEEYLVSGLRVRYGVLDVSVCSRTQPLKTAQLDLRTIDGTHCETPGGTIIGHVVEWRESQHENVPVRNFLVMFRDDQGKAYATQSDGQGIYELQHLPPGMYTPESRLSPNQYTDSSGVPVAAGYCTEGTVHLIDYGVSGTLTPGLGRYVTVKLVGVNGQARTIVIGSVEPDGRFYFRNVPDGEYLLAITSWMQGTGGDFYYPGAFDRRKAARIKVANHVFSGSLDFDPKRLPLVPIPVTVEPSSDSGRFSWRVQLQNSGYIVNDAKWVPGGNVVDLYGVRGVSYRIGLYGYSHDPTVYGDCRSELIPLTANLGLRPIHISIPSDCR